LEGIFQIHYPLQLLGIPTGIRPTLKHSCYTGQIYLSLFLQAIFKIQAPLQLLGLAMSLALPAKLCHACHASQPLAACLARQHGLQFLVGFLIPAALVWAVERRFRRQFLHRKTC
jgi:hypothetical protein